MNYQVKLLGTPEVIIDGNAITFPYRKAEGIFYFLCVTKNTTRDELVSLFWGSSDDSSGRKSLRQALFQIRKCLGDEIIILQGRNGLKLNQNIDHVIDYDAPDEEFSFNRNRFLDFFYLRDCPEFDIWIDAQRELQISRVISYIEQQLMKSSIIADKNRLTKLLDTWQFWKPWDEHMIITGLRCCIQTENYEYGNATFNTAHSHFHVALEIILSFPSHNPMRRTINHLFLNMKTARLKRTA